MIKSISLPLWIVGALCLFLYSFTQVDLSLTLSQASFVQSIQKSFQYIGYFNRPLSTLLFVILVMSLSIVYFLSLWWVKKKKISRRTVWITVFVVGGILALSYNAFSYDLFNYIFDSRIITHYHENPYEHRALDYPGDPMLSFMRWTHRLYPYGPLWLGFSVPLTFIGGEFFLLTFYMFKTLAVGAYFGTIYFLEKIAKKTSLIDPLFAITFFAFHPLVLIEVLVSGHNDITMMFLGVAGFYFLLEKKHIPSLALLGASIAVKFATVFLLPSFLLFYIYQKLRRYNYHFLVFLSIAGMSAAIGIASYRTNFQPWYLLLALPFASLLSNRKEVFVPTLIISLGALFQYVPFLFTGNWDPPIPSILFTMLISSLVVAAIFFVIFSFSKFPSFMRNFWK